MLNLKKLRGLKSLWVLCLSLLIFFCFDVEAGLAHVPHDPMVEIEISPTFNQDQTIFFLTRGLHIMGSLFKSENGGQSWTRIDAGLDNKYKLSSLAISSQPQKTLFVSTLGDGIYKSEDEGISWIKVNQGLTTLSFDLVFISPNSSDVVFAAGTEKGLYQTNNGGKSWEQILDGETKVTAISTLPDRQNRIIIGDNKGILYLFNNDNKDWKKLPVPLNSGAINTITVSPNFSSDKTFFLGTEKGGIFKTVDGGISFKAVNEGLSDKSILSVVISPNYGTDSTLFSATWQKGVFQSNDGGNSWKKYSEGLTKTRQADAWKIPHFKDLRISPTFSQDKTVFLGAFDGLFKSTDGGESWKELDTILSLSGVINSVAISPNYKNGPTVAIATYLDGVSISNDQGTTWTAINKNLEQFSLVKYYRIADLYGIVFSPDYTSDNTLFTGRWGSFFISKDRGKHWDKIDLPKKVEDWDYIIAVAPNFSNDRTIYLGGRLGTILSSTDGGKNFSVVGQVGRPIFSLAVSPNFSSDKTLYASVSDGVYKTVDGGKTWQAASNGIVIKEKVKEGDPAMLPLDQNPFLSPSEQTIAISPNYKVDKTVFAGTIEGLFVTNNGGKSWSKLTGTGEGYIEAITLSPNYQSDRTLLVRVRGKGLFKSIDNGASFTLIKNYSSNPNNVYPQTGPTYFSPEYAIDKTIYAASGEELFRSTDGGNSWSILTTPINKSFATQLSRFSLRLYLEMTNSPIRKFLTALIAAILSYLFIGYLKLDKKLPFRQSAIAAVGAMTTMILVLGLLSI
jgi:photosystem II stability/assembly factor-like uncharacterized protein